MGSKHAGIHLRCDESAEVLTRLKEAFDSKKGPSKEDMMALELIKTFAMRNISAITDPGEKAEKEALLSQVLDRGLKERESGDPAVIVVRRHFVSIYWYDHIRNENLRKEMLEYAHMCGVPALGVGIYDDANFSIYAVRSAGEPDAHICQGTYFFDYEDVAPVEAEDICGTVDAPFFVDALRKALAENDGETMAAVFEQETGLPIMMYEEDCREDRLRLLCRWDNAVVYSEE